MASRAGRVVSPDFNKVQRKIKFDFLDKPNNKSNKSDIVSKHTFDEIKSLVLNMMKEYHKKYNAPPSSSEVSIELRVAYPTIRKAFDKLLLDGKIIKLRHGIYMPTEIMK